MSRRCFLITANLFLFILIVGFILISPPGTLAHIYSYTDENGVVHFTNVPTDPRCKLIIRERHFDPRSMKFDHLISKMSKKYMVDDSLVKAIIRVESNFNPRAVSKVGAQGLMQLMPETAEELKVKNPFNPEENIEGGVRYFKYLLNRFKNNLPLAIAAYNAGENAVKKYNGIPPYDATQKFVKMVLKYFREYKK